MYHKRYFPLDYFINGIHTRVVDIKKLSIGMKLYAVKPHIHKPFGLGLNILHPCVNSAEAVEFLMLLLHFRCEIIYV